MKFNLGNIFRFALLFFFVSLLVACSGSGGGGGSTTPTYTIGGSVTGLTGTLVLQNSGGDNLTVNANGTFTFATKVASAGTYNVTILTQPSLQKCTVTSGTGSVTANVSSVIVSCLSQLGGGLQGRALNLTPTVSTLADTTVSADGTSTAATFNSPTGVASDGTNLFVVDSKNNKIRKIVIATGVVTTLAGSPTNVTGAADGIGTAATFNNPREITSDGTNLYVTDGGNNKIRKIVIATGVVSSFTGVADTATTAGAADGAASAASFHLPSGITSDGTNLYVVDTLNQKIRQIVIATGAVSSFTGAANTPSATGWVDNPAASLAKFWNPYGITTYAGNLYVTDQANNMIRKIVISSGAVTTFAGITAAGATGAADGTAAAATFNFPLGITNDGNNLYVVEAVNNKIRVIGIANGLVSSLTGVTNTATAAGAADGAGSAASFNVPYGITTVGGALYVGDMGNNTVRAIALSTALVTTLAGNAHLPIVTFNSPTGITTDGTNLYIANTNNNNILQVVIATGSVTVLAGSPTNAAGVADGTGTAATFTSPYGITTDGTNLYVTDYGNNKIRKIVIATGVVSSFTGIANTAGTPGAADGPDTTATFNVLYGITTDGTNLYVSDIGNNKIRKIVIATGVVSSFTGVANTASAIGAADGAASVATFNGPVYITTDGTNLYVTDFFNYKIRQIVIATGVVSSLTGVANTPGAAGAVDGAGTAATFNSPTGITTDGTNLYVADEFNYKIRKIVIATGAVSSLTGVANTAGAIGAADGAGTTATFISPVGIISDGANLYVSDAGNNRIRKIQ